ncbi:MAG: hypothetical protein M1813_006032 [Trichoglossum hirsutum]|nr:MAG: hypothetical protein M1813_006032 [Trichoglossum hirsutum]
MTEPEDLDEDLFADLYEGDDGPTKLHQGTKTPAFDSVVSPQPASSNANPTATASDSQQNYQNTQEPSPEQLKNIQEEPYVPAEGDQQMYGNVQNGENPNNWEEGHMNDYGDGNTETQGTGIKEDG